MADHTGITWTDATWNPAWVDALLDQAAAAGTRVHVKQLGAVLAGELGVAARGDRNGKELANLPDRWQIRDYPGQP